MKKMKCKNKQTGKWMNKTKCHQKCVRENVNNMDRVQSLKVWNSTNLSIVKCFEQ